MNSSLEAPQNLPTEDSKAVVDRAVKRASIVILDSRFARLKQRVTFTLSPSQRKLVNVVANFQLNAWAEVYSAFYVGLELAVACTITQMESTGRNIYGADPASSWMNTGPFGRLWEAQVTKANYDWFITNVLQRGLTSNGVGPKQLTSTSLLIAADKRGGAWNPQHNCAEGDLFFKALIAESGGSLWTAFYHYNGSGPAAQNYANIAVSNISRWRSRVP